MAGRTSPDYFADEAEPDIDRLSEMLAVQQQMLAASAELGLLLQQHRDASLARRASIREQFDEVTAVILAYTEKIRSLIAAHHRSE